MKIKELNFDSVSIFSDEIETALHDKAIEAIDAIRRDMMGEAPAEDLDENHAMMGSDDGDGVEFTFDPEDLSAVIKVAKEVGIEYEVDDDDELEITDDDENKIDAFFDALDAAEINYDLEPVEDDVDENIEEGSTAVKRVHTSAKDKLKNKKAYRKNKSKIKIKAKRYRKTSHAKRLKKIGKRKAKQGKTATGRRIIKRI